MHAVCQNLTTEEEVESVADAGFDCSMCRPYMPTSHGEGPPDCAPVPRAALRLAAVARKGLHSASSSSSSETIVGASILRKLSCFCYTLTPVIPT